MKISGVLWAVIGTVLFVGAYVGLYFVYQGEVDRRDELDDKIALNESLLPVMAAQEARLHEELDQLNIDLEERNAELETRMQEIAAAEDFIEEALGDFPGPRGAGATDNNLFALAASNGVEITSIGFFEAGSVMIDGISFDKMGFTIDLGGSSKGILGFVRALSQHESFSKAFIEPLEITIPEPPTTERPTATLDLVFYTYGGK